MESLSHWTLQDFLARAASREATPGGGSVAALAGALAAAMAAMVANLTVGRPRYAAVESECREAIAQAENRRAVLQRLIDEDVRAFEALMAAYRMPQDGPEQQVQRGKAIQEALGDAIRIPLETARAALDVLRLARRLAEIGNANAVSDAGVAACLAEAAVAAALRNVDINLRGLADGARAATLVAEREALAEEARRLGEEADRILDARLDR
ncbi:MAG: cyclodeaminase/cyclohydrolase family protein [Thermoanaerobacterales bacterium]|nr:cyclodeaminase/cyclohydrolase family protein [Bacillota bacterium]MDI6906773.1 cyclodeaminase/cyclohydrolase family protein [Thermoanaerobacterales bacterium]